MSMSRRIEGRTEIAEEQNPLLQVLSSTNVYTLISRLFGRDAVVAAEDRSVLVAGNPCFDDPNYDIAALAADISSEYLANYRIVEALAEEFDFEFHFFLQPVISTVDKDLSNSELIVLGLEDESLIELIDSTYSRISADLSSYPRLHMDMSVFSGIEEAVFIDLCHLNAYGNRIVAEYMSGELY